MEKIALALGSNTGDRKESLRAAVKALAAFVDVMAVSNIYETTPVYIDDQPLFFNAALTGTTKLPPLSLLWNIKRVEAELGRTPTYRFGPRVIDIDIVFYGDQIMTSAELSIPHTHAHEREFVLRPLADIAPGWTHPHQKKTVQELLRSLPDGKAVDLGPLA